VTYEHPDGGSRPGLREVWTRSRRNLGLRREADMMGVTVCIVMLASLMVGSDAEPHSRGEVLLIVWATTLGLTLTHWFAVTLSARLVRDPAFVHSPGQLLLVQMSMALAVTAIATLVVLLAPPELDRFGARVTAAVFLACLVGVESRASGASWWRAASFAAVALVLGVGIASLKWYLTY